MSSPKKRESRIENSFICNLHIHHAFVRINLSKTVFTSIFWPVDAISPTTARTCCRVKPILAKSTIMFSSGTAPGDVGAGGAGGGAGLGGSGGAYAGYAVGYSSLGES